MNHKSIFALLACDFDYEHMAFLLEEERLSKIKPLSEEERAKRAAEASRRYKEIFERFSKDLPPEDS